ncbi:MAG TPA: hypothetical protein PLF90_05065 [bacterium]|nr:hypothetical protein [bacterium]
MPIDFNEWAAEYERNYRRKNISIQYYIDGNGEIAHEYSPYFESISQVLQQRGFLSKKEFISICEWKTKRQKNRYQENSEEDIMEITNVVITGDLNIEGQIYKLTQLEGVGVPVASAILTVVFPNNYCVLDYRVWRALLWVMSETDGFGDYTEFSEIMGNFLNYASFGSYMYYLEKIRTLAEEHNMTPRKIEMALWMYDKKGGILINE